MTKMQAYREADERGAGFLANVILTSHRNPSKKLKGLVNLLRAGYIVKIADFSIDTLVINGEIMAWQSLEAASSPDFRDFLNATCQHARARQLENHKTPKYVTERFYCPDCHAFFDGRRWSRVEFEDCAK